MTNLFRIRTTFSGYPGGPGVMTMYSLDVSTFTDSLQTLLGQVQAAIPNNVQMQVPNGGDIISDLNGDLVGSWTSGNKAMVPGTNAGNYAAPAGMILGWETDEIADGSRIRGRNYLVPLAGDQYEIDGSLLNATVNAFTGFATDFIAAQNASFCIWHRPREARAATATLPALTEHPGGYALVKRVRIPDRVAILRSRRD